MTVAKIWDPATSSWVTAATGPTIAQHNALSDRVDALEAKKGAVLNFQRIWCTVAAYRTASFSGTVAYHTLERGAPTGSDFLLLTYNSPVPFWWECVHVNGLIRKDDAAYHYLYSGLQLGGADQDGIIQQIGIFTGHSTVMQFGSVTTKKTFRLPAGSHTVSAIMGGGNGGTWNYMKNSNCYLEAKAWAQ